MMLSMAVIMIPLLILTVLFSRSGQQADVEAVDWRPVAEQAARQASFEVVAPVELPSGWRATRVSWTQTGEPDPNGDPSPRDRWRLGVLTDQQIYIELDQVDVQPADFVDQITRQGVEDGTSTIGDQSWARLVSTDDRTRSLVLSEPKSTTVVTGDTSYDQLAAYVSLLQPVG